MGVVKQYCGTVVYEKNLTQPIQEFQSLKLSLADVALSLAVNLGTEYSN